MSKKTTVSYFRLNQKEQRTSGTAVEPTPKKKASATTMGAVAAAPLLAVTVFLLRNIDLMVVYGTDDAIIPITLAISIVIGLITYRISRRIAGSIMVFNTMIPFMVLFTVWSSVYSVDIDIAGVEVRLTMLTVSALAALVVGTATARLIAASKQEVILKKGSSIAVTVTYYVLLVLTFLYFVLVIHWHYFSCEGTSYTIAEKFGSAIVPVTVGVLGVGVLVLILVRKFPKLTVVFETVFFMLLIALIVLGLDWYSRIRIFPYTVEGAFSCMRAMQVLGGVEGAILTGIFLSKILPASKRERV